MEIARVRKLKYRLANDMLYRILNVSYIFKYDSKKHCSCDKFHGCPFINGEKSYCKICQITVRYDTNKIERMVKTSDFINYYISLNRELQDCIDFDSKIKNFCYYHYNTLYNGRPIYLIDYFKSFIEVQNWDLVKKDWELVNKKKTGNKVVNNKN